MPMREPTAELVTGVVGGPSEGEKERVVAVLRDRFARGQLSLDDFVVGMERALTAVTRSELEALVGDLSDRQNPVARLVLRAVASLSRFRMQLRMAWRTPQLPALGLPHDGRALLRVGRMPGNEVRLSHPSVSRQHAELRLAEGNWFVRDLGSTNGTQLNGSWVLSATPIREGDRIRFGDLDFRVSAARSAGAAAGAA